MSGKMHRPGREALAFLYLPVYILLFCLAERLVTDGCWVSWCPLDDRIPFVKEFAWAYVLWYPLLAGTALWLLLKDRQGFVRFARMFMVSFTLCIAVFFIFPSCQNLRPETVPGNGPAARIVRWIYAADTSTNVMPSMHVVGTLFAVHALLTSPAVRPAARAGALALGVLIILSTVFIKQHSALDVIGGAALWGLLYVPVYVLPERIRKRPL